MQMADLRECAQGLGLDDVSTYISSAHAHRAATRRDGRYRSMTLRNLDTTLKLAERLRG